MLPKEGGWTPLLVSAAAGKMDAIQWLLSNGADHAQVSREGKTAEALARDHGHRAVAEFFSHLRTIRDHHGLCVDVLFTR